MVAIIDTCPTDAELQQALEQYEGNLLLKELAEGTPGGGLVDLRPDLFRSLDEVVPDWEGWLNLWLDDTTNKQDLRANFYRLSSHGIFSAGIIRDIAPNVPIHLLGALNGRGMSTLDALTDTFTLLPGLIEPGQSLIVNCSWTTSTMPQDNLAPSLAGFEAVADGIFQRALSHLIHWVGEQEGKEILVVAAAGNNALDDPPPNRRPLADYPAGLAATRDNLLSVSATAAKSVDRAAAYSNDRRNSSLRAIATIGGDAVMVAQQTHLRQIAPGEYDAIKGVFTQPTFPIGNGIAPFTGATNETGWAYWAGTSFATPIVSALAAILWDGRPDVPASQVAGEVMGLATMTPVVGFTGVDAIYARQTP